MRRPDFSFRFDRWWRSLPASPRDVGRVELLVIRSRASSDGARELPATVQVSPESGVAGDRWIDDGKRSPGSQVSLMNTHVLRSFANTPEQQALAGDNLVVDLELSEANLPVGTRLAIGTAVLEVSDCPHRPCRKFIERFGKTAAKKVARAGRTKNRGRGLMCRVAQAGEIALGDRISVNRPGVSTATAPAPQSAE